MAYLGPRAAVTDGIVEVRRIGGALRAGSRLVAIGAALGLIATLGACGSSGSSSVGSTSDGSSGGGLEAPCCGDAGPHGGGGIFPTTTLEPPAPTTTTSIPALPQTPAPPLAARPPSAASAQSLTQQCSDFIEQARNFTYQPKLQMVVGQEYPVTVVATTSGQASRSDFANSAPTTIIAIPTACQVQLRLYSLDFKVTPSDWSQQGFYTSDKLTWNWIVSPLQAGSLQLKLEIQPMLLQNGQAHLASIADKSTIINVTANAQPIATSLGHDLTSAPVLIIVGAVITGLVTAWAATRFDRRKKVRRRREDKDMPENDDDGPSSDSGVSVAASDTNASLER